MTPNKSYRIWFSQRNGSTLLCKGLEQTGVAGKPGEYFNVMEHETLCQKYKVDNYIDLKNTIWQHGTSDNLVFGIKHSMHTARFEKIFAEIKNLKGIPDNEVIDHETLLKDLFPNCKHIYLTRRNKIRQAVSWWKAIKDNQWHLTKQQDENKLESFYETEYDFDALTHLFKEANLRECAMQAYFSEFNINPLTIVYEDFSDDFANTIKRIVDYLEIKVDRLEIKEKYYKKTSNDLSEIWVQRFRNELQENMDMQIW